MITFANLCASLMLLSAVTLAFADNANQASNAASVEMNQASTSSSSQASQASAASSSVGRAPRIYEAMINPGNKYYTQEQADQGIQGDTFVNIQLDDEFKIVSSEVREKSRDEQIDAMAIAFLHSGLKSGFKVDDGYNHEVIKVRFVKVRIETLKNKTCADLNIDQQYFKKIYPEKKVTEMYFWNAYNGLMYLNYLTNAKKTLDTATVSQLVIEECSQYPEKLFTQVYQSHLKFQ